MWDVAQYTRFQTERTRPFIDLVNQITNADPKTVIDLGCGTGEQTATLLGRWPTARILGLDSSPEMLNKAGARAQPGRLDFQFADIATWQPTGPVDIVLSNAALHRLPDHLQLFARLASYLSSGGTLAVQMPNRFRAPSQQAIEDAIAAGPWRDRLHNIGLHRESVLPTESYTRLLLSLGFTVNAWDTTYYHILHGEHASLEWLKGTALRPLLAVLPSNDHPAFLAAAAARLNEAYLKENGTTVFPMQRLFVVATRTE